MFDVSKKNNSHCSYSYVLWMNYICHWIKILLFLIKQKSLCTKKRKNRHRAWGKKHGDHNLNQRWRSCGKDMCESFRYIKLCCNRKNHDLLKNRSLCRCVTISQIMILNILLWIYIFESNITLQILWNLELNLLIDL